jgi:hypothetical protein
MPSKIVLDRIGLRSPSYVRLHSLFRPSSGGGMSGSTIFQNESDSSDDLSVDITCFKITRYVFI